MSRLRHTEQRMAVLRTVKFATTPLTATEIVTRLRVHSISRATIFRSLKHYVGLGEIASIDGRDGQTRYVGHAFHEAMFRCQRCGKERRLQSATLPGYVDRKMFGHQSVITSQLIAQGLCSSCAKKSHVSS